jgi:hypothetical protein
MFACRRARWVGGCNGGVSTTTRTNANVCALHARTAACTDVRFFGVCVCVCVCGLGNGSWLARTHTVEPLGSLVCSLPLAFDGVTY